MHNGTRVTRLAKLLQHWEDHRRDAAQVDRVGFTRHCLIDRIAVVGRTEWIFGGCLNLDAFLRRRLLDQLGQSLGIRLACRGDDRHRRRAKLGFGVVDTSRDVRGRVAPRQEDVRVVVEDAGICAVENIDHRQRCALQKRRVERRAEPEGDYRNLVALNHLTEGRDTRCRRIGLVIGNGDSHGELLAGNLETRRVERLETHVDRVLLGWPKGRIDAGLRQDRPDRCDAALSARRRPGAGDRRHRTPTRRTGTGDRRHRTPTRRPGAAPTRRLVVTATTRARKQRNCSYKPNRSSSHASPLCRSDSAVSRPLSRSRPRLDERRTLLIERSISSVARASTSVQRWDTDPDSKRRRSSPNRIRLLAYSSPWRTQRKCRGLAPQHQHWPGQTNVHSLRTDVTCGLDARQRRTPLSDHTERPR